MDMTLTRTAYLSDGIFGQFASEDGSFQCDTIEHAYQVNGAWASKIPTGVYICQRRLSPHFGYFVFQVMNVPNCTYIEIHRANTEADVIGCIGLGQRIGKLNGLDAVLQSADAFNAFMDIQIDSDTFQLTVVDAPSLTASTNAA